MKILAIDPGQTGALVTIESGNGKITAIKDMPVMAKITGKGKTINELELSRIIRVLGADIAYVEKVHAMPKQGVSSVFEFGYGVGLIHGILASNLVPTFLVTPQSWKRYCGLINKQKDASRSLAITRHPEVADQLNLKKHHGRGDAICIADYARKLEGEKI